MLYSISSCICFQVMPLEPFGTCLLLSVKQISCRKGVALIHIALGYITSNDKTAFNFGIFDDALTSGVVYSTDLICKLCYCCWWGLQNLSSLGQGLKTSQHIWEISFGSNDRPGQ